MTDTNELRAKLEALDKGAARMTQDYVSVPCWPHCSTSTAELTARVAEQDAEIARLREALVEADETFEQVLDDMRGEGKCVCGAVKQEIIETHAIVITALKEHDRG